MAAELVQMVTKNEDTRYHCSGCERIMECELAFKSGSEKCDLYVRASYFQCHRCLRFGGVCQRSGLIKCDFLPRVTGDPLEKIRAMRKGIEK